MDPKSDTNLVPHRTLNGALWHWPMKGDPSRCGEPKCQHRMKVHKRPVETTDLLASPKFRRRKT